MLDNAIYIQYPINYTQYKEYDIKGIKRLPLPKQGEMYDNWKLNHNHFTTEYHRRYSLPLLCELLHLSFDVGDFELNKMVNGNNDISLLKPKNEYFYEIFGYTRGEHFDNRKRMPLYKEIESVTFTDVLIELNHLNISEYLKTNFGQIVEHYGK